MASNLQNSQVEVCFCALRNTPVDLAKVYYLESFAIRLLNIISKGSSIKDVRKEGGGGQGKRDTCGHRGEGGQARVDVHKKILKKVSKKT